MSQLTFTGNQIPLNRLKKKCPDNIPLSHRIVLTIFNGADELTYPRVEQRLSYRIDKGEIQETGNRLRDLVDWELLERFEKFDQKSGKVKTHFRLPRRR